VPLAFQGREPTNEELKTGFLVLKSSRKRRKGVTTEVEKKFVIGKKEIGKVEHLAD